MPFWNFAESEDDIELRIEGEMVSDDDAWYYEWLGIAHAAPNKFREQLSAYKGQNIRLWIDSLGGDVFAGVGIYNALKEHKGKVITVIDGKAMSAATMPAMAGDEVHMTPGSIMMIHNPWTMSVGEAKDMLHTAEILGEIKEAIINIYRTKTGRSHNKLSELMDSETWMSAKTAVNEGFADKVLYKENTEPVAALLNRTLIMNSISGSMLKALDAFKRIQPEQFEEARPAPVDLYKAKLRINERKMKL